MPGPNQIRERGKHRRGLVIAWLQQLPSGKLRVRWQPQQTGQERPGVEGVSDHPNHSAVHGQQELKRKRSRLKRLTFLLGVNSIAGMTPQFASAQTACTGTQGGRALRKRNQSKTRQAKAWHGRPRTPVDLLGFISCQSEDGSLSDTCRKTPRQTRSLPETEGQTPPSEGARVGPTVTPPIEGARVRDGGPTPPNEGARVGSTVDSTTRRCLSLRLKDRLHQLQVRELVQP